MKRIRSFEFEDLIWFPSFIRQYMMDFLRFVLHTGNLYKPVTPILINGLENTKNTDIIDLCSGAGGAIKSVQNNIKKLTGKLVPFTLTDKFPNVISYQQLQQSTNGSINYCSQSVDATDVPSSLKGFRTIFSGFHHFDETTAQQVLQNAVNANEGIAIFDGGSKSIYFILTILVFHPLAFIFFTPFIKPFSWRRLLFTYLLPVVPLCSIWDGIVSVLRLYTPEHLLLLAKQTDSRHYTWQAGTVTNNVGIRITYLVGYPNK